MTIYFISDLHLDHGGLLPFRCRAQGREFGGTAGMNQWLIGGWNSVVKKKDIVYVLGDVSWSLEGLALMDQMNGRKRLVLGNHDTERIHISEFTKYFEEIHGVTKKYGIVMTHVPIHPDNLEFRWERNMHGHIHDPLGLYGEVNPLKSLAEQEKSPVYFMDNRYMNVNVDVIGNVPISLEEVRVKWGIEK